MFEFKGFLASIFCPDVHHKKQQDAEMSHLCSDTRELGFHDRLAQLLSNLQVLSSLSEGRSTHMWLEVVSLSPSKVFVTIY